jgi:DNA-binding response OmpR family regulator
MNGTRKRKTGDDAELLLAVAHRKQTGGDQFLLPAGMMIEGSEVLANAAANVIVIGQLVIELTPTEYALIRLLLRQAGTPVSSEALIQAAFPNDSTDSDTGTRRLARHITNIRPKLWQTPLLIHAVNNFGYVLRFSTTPAQFPQRKRKDM